jgi:hypothetical protein
MGELGAQQVREIVAKGWDSAGNGDGGVVASLSGLIGIPALSPAFDAGWAPRPARYARDRADPAPQPQPAGRAAGDHPD